MPLIIKKLRKACVLD